MSFTGISVTTPAPKTELTTRARVKQELGITSATDDALIDQAIDDASSVCASFCNRTFVRQEYSENGPAFGGIEFQCRQAPVTKLSAVTYFGNALTDVSIGDRLQGVLYRQSGFDWTAQRFGGLTGGQREFLDWGTPLLGQEEPNWSVSYRAGFIPPGHELVSSTGISVLSSDASFNSSAKFPALLSSGDVIEASGFTNAANNGRFVVAAGPTASKIKVSVALVAESSTGSAKRSFTFANLPADVEKAVVETAKHFYGNRKAAGTPGAIVEKQLGIARVRYSETAGSIISDPMAFALPPVAAGLLRRWVRGL